MSPPLPKFSPLNAAPLSLSLFSLLGLACDAQGKKKRSTKPPAGSDLHPHRTPSRMNGSAHACPKAQQTPQNPSLREIPPLPASKAATALPSENRPHGGTPLARHSFPVQAHLSSPPIPGGSKACLPKRAPSPPAPPCAASSDPRRCEPPNCPSFWKPNRSWLGYSTEDFRPQFSPTESTGPTWMRSAGIREDRKRSAEKNTGTRETPG